MKIVSASEMREIDRSTSERFGVPSLTLMENAGTAVANFILSNYSEERSIGIICGKGNNGGDGFVVARSLVERGRKVQVLLLCAPEELRGDAAAMFAKLQLAPIIVRDVSDLESDGAIDILNSELLVDALLGTGFHPPVSALYVAAIGKLNASSAPIVAVDIPSGADADATQKASGLIVRADAIVTFTAPKPAHVFGELTDGTTRIAPIGSPPEAITSSSDLNLSTPDDFADLLAPRPRESNKGSYGHVLVIGGSVGKAGAAWLAGYAALRAGAGLCTVATAKSAFNTVAGFSPELMTEQLEETKAGTISPEAIKSGCFDALADGKTVLAIGPGISRNPETAEFVRNAVARYKQTIVLDADGLNAFEGMPEKLSRPEGNLVVTPHPGEMVRLTGLSIAEIQSNRVDVAREFAKKYHVIVVLKGHRTLTVSPNGTVWVNPTGNPGMATGGTGDVLTGMIAGLVAQYPKRVLEATALAVYLHGSAGDEAAEQQGEASLIALDLLRYVGEAFIAAERSIRIPMISIHP